MKKRDIVDLIRAHYDHDDSQFRLIAQRVAGEFEQQGDQQLASYIMMQTSEVNSFVPQSVTYDTKFLTQIGTDDSPLPLPNVIANDLKGIINAVGHQQLGLGRFLFQGEPGTGKTASVKQLARILDRTLLMVDFNQVIDSKLGQTAKNIAAVFNEINQMPNLSRVVILFDEIDALALDRLDAHDVREMGRATSSVLKELDNVNPEALIIATTNLYDQLDAAFKRRFDKVVDFNRYQTEDLVAAGEVMLNANLAAFKSAGHDIKLFRKILTVAPKIPNPGELRNSIKVAIGFSDPQKPYEYLALLYKDLMGVNDLKLAELRDQGFTIREIGILTGMSKSTVARELKGAETE